VSKLTTLEVLIKDFISIHFVYYFSYIHWFSKQNIQLQLFVDNSFTSFSPLYYVKLKSGLKVFGYCL